MVSPQEGVGDTTDSFAYDGHRVRKWNVSTGKYGEVQISKNVLIVIFRNVRVTQSLFIYPR